MKILWVFDEKSDNTKIKKSNSNIKKKCSSEVMYCPVADIDIVFYVISLTATPWCQNS